MTKRSVLQIKLFICVLMLTAAIGFMVHLLWPRLGLLDMGLYVLAGWGILAGLFAALVVNTAISPAVSVRVVDQYNNLVTTDSTDQVTVALGANPGQAILGGTTTLTVSGKPSSLTQRHTSSFC